MVQIHIYFFLSFQFTRSHRGDKDKDKVPDHDQEDSTSEVDEGNLSVMDRTKRQALAAKQQQADDAPADGEVQDLEVLVRQAQDRVNAAKAAKSRAASLRQKLQELQEEEQSIAASEDVDQTPVSAPAALPNSDPGAFVSASLKSAVIIFFLFGTYRLFKSFPVFIFWPLALAPICRQSLLT